MSPITQPFARAAAALLLALSASLAGCGGGGDAPEDGPDVPTPSACQATPRPPSCL